MKNSKKILMFYVLLLALVGTIVMGITPTHALTETWVDIWDDTEVSNGSYTISLQADTQYQFIVPALDATSAQELEVFYGLTSVEIYSYNANMTYYDSGDYASVYAFFTTGINESFTTGTSADTIELYVGGNDTSGWNSIFDGSTYDVQLLELQGDTIPPTYSYTNLSIDTPYYDLITEAEIRAQLSATDPEEGDVTSRIQVYNDTYTSASKVVGGNYYIMYMVDDTSGNSAYLQVDINVIDDLKPYLILTNDSISYGQDDSTLTIDATYTDGHIFDFTWYEGEIIPLSLTSVFGTYPSDEYYGVYNFTGSEWSYSISGDDTTGAKLFHPETLEPGQYTIYYSVTDPSGNTSVFTFDYEVLFNNAPVISGPETIDLEMINGGLEDILSSYSATDIEDGSIMVAIQNTSLGMGEEWSLPNLGESMTVTLEATDNYGKTTTKDITVTMIDTSDPVFEIDNIEVSTYTHNVYMSDTSTLQTLIDSIVVTDAYDGDLTASIVVPAFPSFSVPGSTDITITCTDPQDNTSSLVLTVNVVDDIEPVINGATKVVKGITAVLTVSDITAELTATDNIDGMLTVEVVSDGYTGNSANIGSYVIQYKATDTAGNIAYHEVRVWVIDNQAPAWVYNDFFVEVTPGEIMTRTELVSLLQAAGMIGDDISYTVTFVTDEYTGYEDIEGAYQVTMNIVYEDGSEDNITVELTVPEDVNDDDVIVVEPEEELTGLQKAIRWVKNAGIDVWNFIKTCGNGIKDGSVWVYDHILKPAWEFVFGAPDDDTDIPVYTTTESEVTTTTTDQQLNVTTTITAEDIPGGSTESPYNYL